VRFMTSAGPVNTEAEEATVSVHFDTITFSDGTTIQLAKDDILVLVGPNNSGKSAALRELEQVFGKPQKQTVIHAATVRKTGTTKDLRKMLRRHGRSSWRPGENYKGYRYEIRDDHLDHYWNNQLQGIQQVFCTLIRTETRLTDSNSAGSIALWDNPPTHPIQLLYEDDRIETRISGYFKRAFGVELMVFRGGGGAWPLLTGERPPFENGEDRASFTYHERVRQAAVPLQNQGDGMRAFASVILHMLAPST
jgi:energy-coupling factor transporter ATP-binding protein EcfA2